MNYPKEIFEEFQQEIQMMKMVIQELSYTHARKEQE